MLEESAAERSCLTISRPIPREVLWFDFTAKLSQSEGHGSLPSNEPCVMHPELRTVAMGYILRRRTYVLGCQTESDLIDKKPVPIIACTATSSPLYLHNCHHLTLDLCMSAQLQ
jgi:hypothetical protein